MGGEAGGVGVSGGVRGEWRGGDERLSVDGVYW